MSASWAESPAWLATIQEAEACSGFPLKMWMACGPEEDLKAPHHAPCAVVAHSVGLYRAHRSAGMPLAAAATGHSLGFYSALVAAGVMTLEGVFALIEAVEALAGQRFGDRYGMAFFIGIEEDGLRQELALFPELALSNVNGKAQFTVSGPRSSLVRLVDCLASSVLKAGLLPVLHPLHGVHMEPLLPELRCRMEAWEPQPPEFPILSMVDGRMLRDGAEIWREAMNSVALPVCWPSVVQALHPWRSGLWECGAGQQLANLTRWANRDLSVASLQGRDPALGW